ncbi:putative LysR family transcriptional regulator [Gordonia effusa NBRC 100432]|uniref:Putative LysR family transcriptional regulator n=1 Tax=Gordonia effusa NBRC 100432 TaxID=1077974 RepID=H0R1E3_9ACTN|nr:LysR family transcriptional regulator [Gordonia effusa]GAB18894.1 putative LysR family transcriptional regulator [Gordonia effusa NBRC 100432]
MDIKRLRILREFADRGSVGAVALAMHMTPSAVSQQLKVLSREVGVEVTEPAGRNIRLTDAGRALVLRADAIIAAVDHADDEMRAYRGGSSPVRLASFPSGAALLLPKVLTSARADDVTVIASELDVGYADAPKALADNHIVVTHRDERAPSVSDARLAVTELTREPIDVVVARDSPLAQRDTVEVGDLADFNWISVEGGFPVDDVLLSVAAVTGVQPRVTQRLLNFDTIEAIVAADGGIALMPRYVIRHPGVKPLTLKGVRAARVYEALTRPDPSASVRRVLGYLLDAV